MYLIEVNEVLNESIGYSNDLWYPHGGAQRVRTSEYAGSLTALITLGQQSSVNPNYLIKNPKAQKTCPQLASQDFLSMLSSGYLTEGFQ